jgi:manganese transport protein
MAGFVRLRIPLVLRRLLTMLPALFVLGLGVGATDVLNFSQVVLSFGIPFALIPLLLITRDRSVMGQFANRAWLTGLTLGITTVIIGLNAFLIATDITG